MLSLFKPLALLILATLEPYFRAMLHSESPDFTVCRREDEPLLLLLLAVVFFVLLVGFLDDELLLRRGVELR